MAHIEAGPQAAGTPPPLKAIKAFLLYAPLAVLVFMKNAFKFSKTSLS